MNKYFYFFLNLVLTICFNPLPEGNGILNAEYSHNSTDNLYFIFEHFRHGARSPCEGTFINKRDELGGKWDGYGALTNVGIKQQFLLGKKNRKHYKNYISKEYNPNEIKVYSTNYNRTIMSAQAQLLGFYNNFPFNNSIKFEDIEKIPKKSELNSIIPQINLFEKEEKSDKDVILFSEKFECKLHKELLAKNMEKSNELRIFNKIDEIRENFNKKYISIFGNEFNKPNYTEKYKGMYKFCDIYIAHYFDKGKNRKIIDNLEEKYNFYNSSEILDICYNFFHEKFLIIESEEYAKNNYKIIMSRTLNKLIKIMKERITRNDPNYTSQDSPKFLLYSGHDDTLTQMQIFLNKHFNINKEWVPFASNQIFELRKYGNNFFVEVYYNDRLKMNITFDEFSSIVKKNILSLDEINNKCYGIKHSNHFGKYLFLCWIIIICLASFIFLNVSIYLNEKNNTFLKEPKIIMIS